MTEAERKHTIPWWGEFAISPDATVVRQVGSLWIGVRRLTREWQIFSRNDETKDLPWTETAEPLPFVVDEEKVLGRHIVGSGQSTVSLSPLLADRPVVTRPVVPFVVQPGQESTVFVSTPIWVRLAVESPSVVLEEIPCQLMSDTWFGPTTMEGEICYASWTSCRLRLEELPLRPHRAVTPVKIKNEADTPLLLEKINLPVPFLAIYSAGDSGLWTQGVTMIRRREDAAVLEISDGAPDMVPEAAFLAGPRKTPDRKTFISKLSALIG